MNVFDHELVSCMGVPCGVNQTRVREGAKARRTTIHPSGSGRGGSERSEPSHSALDC